jgi:hypothetical protein
MLEPEIVEYKIVVDTNKNNMEERINNWAFIGWALQDFQFVSNHFIAVMYRTKRENQNEPA